MTSRFDALFDLGRYDEALRVAVEERGRDPESYTAACHVAQALVGLERWEDAVAAAGDALALYPEDELAHRLRGIALRELGRHGEAVAACEEAVRLDENEISTWYCLFQAYVGAGRPGDALRVAHVLTTTFPGDADSHVVMALVALQRQQWPLAEHACRTALSIDPGHRDALHNLGVALHMQNRGREAIELMTAAVRADPDDPLTQEVLGRVAVRQALVTAAIAVPIVVLAAILAPEPENGSALLPGVLVFVSGGLAYAVYRTLSALRIARFPVPARHAAAVVFRRQDRFAFGFLAVVLVAYVLFAAVADEGAAAVTAAVAGCLATAWAFDGRWGLPRFASLVDGFVRLTGRGRSAPPYG